MGEDVSGKLLKKLDGILQGQISDDRAVLDALSELANEAAEAWSAAFEAGDQAPYLLGRLHGIMDSYTAAGDILLENRRHSDS